MRDRLFSVEENKPSVCGTSILRNETPKLRLKSFIREGSVRAANVAEVEYASGVPIAELYPDTTVMFADISGFTAWSSARSPTQVRRYCRKTILKLS